MFDVAKRLILAEVDGGLVNGRAEANLPAMNPGLRARHLAELGVDVLICGAISWPMEAGLRAAGIRVIRQTCGWVEDVLRAFAAGGLNERAFLMPGCCGRRNRRGRARGRGRRYGSP